MEKLDRIKTAMINYDIDFHDAKYYIKYGTDANGMTPCEMGGFCHCDGSC